MKTESKWLVIACLCLTAGICQITSMVLEYSSGLNSIQQEAIEKGHATILEINGKEQFVWYTKGDTKPNIIIKEK